MRKLKLNEVVSSPYRLERGHSDGIGPFTHKHRRVQKPSLYANTLTPMFALPWSLCAALLIKCCVVQRSALCVALVAIGHILVNKQPRYYTGPHSVHLWTEWGPV